MQNRKVFEKTTKTSLFWSSLVAFLLCLGVILFPQSAYASSYQITDVHIKAEVKTNGDLAVTETRTFALHGAIKALTWSLDSMPANSRADIESVSVLKEDELISLPSTTFNEDWRITGGPSSSAYAIDSKEKTAYLFFDAHDEQAQVTVAYTVPAALNSYQDVAELYWRFVDDSWDAASEKVELEVTLPTPPFATVVAGETVYAWAHGPRDLNADIEQDGTVVCKTEQVAAGSYAEVRIALPSGWLTDIAPTANNVHPNESRLDGILHDEQIWIDYAQAQQTQNLIGFAIAAIFALAVCIWAYRVFKRYGTELTPTAVEESIDEAPVAGEHVAVIGRVCRFNEVNNQDFAATLTQLVSEGGLRLAADSAKAGPCERQNFTLWRVPVSEYAPKTELDRKAISFMFEEVAGGADLVTTQQVAHFAKSNPACFAAEMKQWNELLSDRVAQGAYLERYATEKKTQMIASAIGSFFVCATVGHFTGSIPALALGVVLMVLLLFASNQMERRTQKGVDVQARAMALKNWLLEADVADVEKRGLTAYAYLLDAAADTKTDLALFAYALEQNMNEALPEAKPSKRA